MTMTAMTTTPPQSATSPRKLRRWVWSFAGVLLLLLAVGGGYNWMLGRFEQSCRVAKAEKRWADLQSLALRWSSWNPNSGAAWVYLADAVQHQDRFVEAAEYLSRVPEGSLEELPSRLVRCKILMGPANQPFAGEQACLELLAREPKATGAHELLIQYYAVTLQRDKLRRQIAEAIRAQREPPDAYIYVFFIDSLRLAQGPDLCELWLKSFPDNEILTVAGVLHRADTALHDPSSTIGPDPTVLTEMERDARNLLKQFPHNTNLLAFLIDEEITKGRVEHVLALLGQSTSDAERDPRFWRFQGWIHFVRGEVDDAERAYRKALSLHPMDWLTLHRLAELERTRGASAEVVRLEGLVKRAHILRIKIRELPTAQNPPKNLLREIGRLARDSGDSLIAEALQRRLGLTDPPQTVKPVIPK